MYMSGYIRGTSHWKLLVGKGFWNFVISANPHVFVRILCNSRSLPAFVLGLRLFPVICGILTRFSVLSCRLLWRVWYGLYPCLHAHVYCAMLLLSGFASDFSGSFWPVQHVLRACLHYWLVPSSRAMSMVHFLHACAFYLFVSMWYGCFHFYVSVPHLWPRAADVVSILVLLVCCLLNKVILLLNSLPLVCFPNIYWAPCLLCLCLLEPRCGFVKFNADQGRISYITRTVGRLASSCV